MCMYVSMLMCCSSILDTYSCPVGEKYICRTSNRCIDQKHLCDGENDCIDPAFMDEYYCRKLDIYMKHDMSN